MATSTIPYSSGRIDGHHAKIRHPLQSLRGYIRTYVLLEGTAVAILFVALCFWAAMLLDYGLFELTGFDWIKHLDRGFADQPQIPLAIRAVLLGIFLVALIAVVVWWVLRRLFTEFSDSALALVLERRFPHQLGDRLITAVELADPALAEKYGYSQAMVEYTIRSAAERVEQLPVHHVFNWRRLLHQWALALGCSVGVWLGALASFAIVAQAQPETTFQEQFASFTRANFVLAKRNALLRDRMYWPTRSYVEIVGFPESGVMRLGIEEKPRPIITIQAFEYVIYDPEAFDSIRPLRVEDLEQWVGEEMLNISLPENDWSGWKRWSIDEIRRKLDDGDIRRRTRAADPAAVEKLEELCLRVDELAASPWTNWDIRRLSVPSEVYIYGRGKAQKIDRPESRKAGNRYYFDLDDLTESISFYVQAENYYTTRRRIELLPPPTFSQLLLTKWEPAYRYYWLKGGDQSPLKGRKQKFYREPVELMGTDSRAAVAFGADIELTAIVDRDLSTDPSRAPKIKPVDERFAKMKGALVPKVPPKVIGSNVFMLRLDDVRKPYEFEFHFVDKDNVRGKRHVIIEPMIDVPPDEIIPLVLDAPLRKPQMKGVSGSDPTGLMSAYLITPDAIIPVKGTMKDDVGLTAMRWLYEYEPVDFELIGEEDLSGKPKKPQSDTPRARRVSTVVATFHNLSAPLAPNPAAGAHLMFLGSYLASDLKLTKANVTAGAIRMKRFQERLALLEADAVDPAALEGKLDTGSPQQVLPKVHSAQDEEGFDVGMWLSEKIKVDDPTKQGQLHYRLTIWIEAEDNNIEAPEPGRRKSKLPITFVIVTEKELLAQILIEEERLRAQLEKAINTLQDAKTTLEAEIGKLDSTEPPLFTMDDRVRDKIIDPLRDKTNSVQEVVDAFRRIREEMRINRVSHVKLEERYAPKVRDNRIHDVTDNIIRPLSAVTKTGDGLFTQTETSAVQLLDAINQRLAAAEQVQDEGQKKAALYRDLDALRDKARVTHKNLTELIRKLEDALDGIGGELKWGRIVETARQLERDQRMRVVNPLRQAHARILADLGKLLGDLQ